MTKKEFYFESNSGTNKIHAVKWIPDKKPICIVQIVHGMAEYVERYEEFAAFLTEKGILAVGEDHLGHGKSIGDNPPGYICEKEPHKILVEDVHTLKDIIREEYPEVPYVIFGHSMGSFITRNFIQKYGSEVDGAVISATGMQPEGMLKIMKMLVVFLQIFQGNRHVSRLMDKLAFGSYLKRIENPASDFDWLSVNSENVQNYLKDELCGFVFTLNGFKALADLCLGLYDYDKIVSIPKDFPVFFIYGDEDPVGDYGAGVMKAYGLYESAGMKKLSRKLYPGRRHELLNEMNKEEVMQDIYAWLREMVLER